MKVNNIGNIAKFLSPMAEDGKVELTLKKIKDLTAEGTVTASGVSATFQLDLDVIDAGVTVGTRLVVNTESGEVVEQKLALETATKVAVSKQTGRSCDTRCILNQ